MAKKRKSDDNAVQAGEPLCGLNYWIKAGVDIPNPSPFLRRRALRLDGSNWLIFRSQFPHAAFARLQRDAGGEEGMRFWINEFAPSAQEGLMQQAAFALRLKLRELVAEMDQSIDLANSKLEDAATRRQRERQEGNRVKAIKRTREALEDLQRAAQVYGLAAGNFQFDAVSSYARALERSQYRRTAEIGRLAELARGTELEAAARNDDVPPEILADFLEEQGQDVAAARIALGQVTDPERQFDAAIQQADREDSERAAEAKMARDEQAAAPSGRFLEHMEGSWARLRDGSWGARLVILDDGNVRTGDRVTLVRGNGQRAVVRLGEMEVRFRRGNVTLWRCEAAETEPEPTQLQDADASPGEERAEPEVPVAPAKPEVTTTFLIKGNWTIKYAINCTKATVTRTFGREEVEVLQMTRKEAQDHYRASEAQGYKRAEF